MKHLLAAMFAVALPMVAAPGLAQDKKVETTTDAPKAAPTKDTAKADTGAKAAAKSDEPKKETKKKERKGGC